MNRPKLRSTRLALAPILAAAMLAAGCGTSGSDDASSAESEDTEATSTTSGSTDDTSDASAPEADDAPDEATEGEDAASGDTGSAEGDDASNDGSCLVGNWVLTEETMNSYYDALANSMDDAPVDLQIAGSTTLDLNPDGTFEYLPTFTLTLDTGGVEGEGVTSGSVRGTYTIDSETSTVLADITEDDLDIVVTVSGITVSSAEMGIDLALAPINEAPFDCSGQDPVLMFEVADGTRVPVALTPA